MGSLLDIEYRKLLSEVDFLSSNLEYHEAVVEYAKKEFEEQLKAISKEEGVYDKFFPDESKTESAEEPEEEGIIPCSEPPPKSTPPPAGDDKIKQPEKKATRKEVKELYRRIVAETHPDKLLGLSDQESDRRKKMFIKATAALERDDLGKMQQVAIELGIDLGEASSAKVVVLREEASKIRDRIRTIKGTYAWIWHEATSEKERKKIIKMYINQLLP